MDGTPLNTTLFHTLGVGGSINHTNQSHLVKPHVPPQPGSCDAFCERELNFFFLELTMAEMRQSLEQEQERLVAEAKKQTELEKQQGVDETKKKQWCASCRKEAIFYCCWNTSYCDYPCQQAHWPEHMKSCTQSGNSGARAPTQGTRRHLSASKLAAMCPAAPQQEAEAEPAADSSNKGAGQATCGPNALREAPLSASSNTDRETESCGDAAAVASSQLGAT